VSAGLRVLGFWSIWNVGVSMFAQARFLVTAFPVSLGVTVVGVVWPWFLSERREVGMLGFGFGG
jgi:hypothetical protein